MPSNPSIIVQLPQPCAESWESMEPNSCGRFCGSCKETVIDFTEKTDDEILKIMTRSGNIPCGRFNETQLNRTIIASNTKSTKISSHILPKIAASFLLLQTMATHAFAQHRKHIATEQVIHPRDTICNTDLILEGIVKDYLDDEVWKYYKEIAKQKIKNTNYENRELYNYKEKLINIELSITGTDYKTCSDKNGRFRFVLPASLKGKELTITATYHTDSSPERPNSKIRPLLVKFGANEDHLSIEVLRYDYLKLDTIKIEARGTSQQYRTFGGAPVVYST